MATLIIQRKKEFTNAMLGFYIFLNDKKIGKIDNGEIKKWAVEPGNYRLIAKKGIILKSQTVSFYISKDETKIFNLENFGNGYVKTFLKLKEISRKAVLK